MSYSALLSASFHDSVPQSTASCEVVEIECGIVEIETERMGLARQRRALNLRVCLTQLYEIARRVSPVSLSPQCLMSLLF